MNPYKIGDVVDVDAGPNGLWEYIGTGTVKDTRDYVCWVEMDNGESKRVHVAQLRLRCRGAK